MKKYINLTLTVLFCLLVLPITAVAVQAELVDLGHKQDIVVVISYDKVEPVVTIISPSGDKYAKDADYDAVERGDNVMYLYIKDAEAGSWSIDYSKKSNTQIDAMVMPWYHTLSVDSLTITSQEDDTISVSAEVSCEEDTRYEYYLYAVTLNPDDTVNEKKELKNGSGRSGNTLNISASTKGLMDGNYHLQLEVYFTTDDGVELPTFYMTDYTFSVTGNTMTGEKSRLNSILNITENVLYLDWSAVEEKVSSWTLAVYPSNAADGAEPYYYCEFEPEETTDSIILDETAGDMKLRLVGVLSDGNFISFEREIILDSGVTVKFETPENTNALQGSINYDAAGYTLRAVLTINEKSQQLQLSGSGILSLTLDEMEVNEVSLMYGWEDGIYYMVSQRIAVDSIPPMLDLYGVSDRITVKDKNFKISGGTEAGAVLTVNGTEQTVDESGNFLAELTLNEGDNTLLFEASDSAGNKTSRTLIVNYSPSGKVSDGSGDGKSNVPWLMIITAVSSLATMFIMWLFYAVSLNKKKKAGVNSGLAMYKLAVLLNGLCCSIILVSIGASVYFFVRYNRLISTVSGKNLPLALQQKSTQQIAEIIRQSNAYKSTGIVFAVIGAVALVVFVLLIFLGHYLGRGKSDPNKKAKTKINNEPKKQTKIRSVNDVKDVKTESTSEIKAEPKAEIETETTDKSTDKTICPYCGGKLRMNAKFCGKCGKELKW